jgi:alanine dehydrogenase
MIVGILKEIKTAEHRVCMTPAGVEGAEGKITCRGVAEAFDMEYSDIKTLI